MASAWLGSVGLCGGVCVLRYRSMARGSMGHFWLSAHAWVIVSTGHCLLFPVHEVIAEEAMLLGSLCAAYITGCVAIPLQGSPLHQI